MNRSLNIKMKLLGSFGIVAAIMLVMGVVSFICLSMVATSLKDIGENELPAILALNAIAASQATIQMAERSLINPRLSETERKEQHQKIADAWARSEAAWQGFESLEHDAAERELWKKFGGAWETWKEDHQRLMGMIADWEKNRTDDRITAATRQALDLVAGDAGIVEGLMDQLVEWSNKNAMEQKDAAGPLTRLAIGIMLLAMVAGVAAAVAFGFLISTNITGAVRKGLAFARLLARGDLTERIAVDQHDELGQLAAALNDAADRLEQLVGSIQSAAMSLTQGAEQISSGNQNLSQRTAEQASSLEEIASTIEQTTATINQNYDNSIQASSITEESSRIAENGGRLVGEAVDAINEINATSARIGEIISVINDIAFQTNLLALNAAVEAARAGDAGRGFAVVAGEVRNLAQRSGNAAQEIGDLIKSSIDKIAGGAEKANRSREALTAIITSVRNVRGVVEEITASSSEQKQGISQINTAISEMDGMTQQNAAMVEETASASESVSGQARELMSMIQQFRTRERGAARKELPAVVPEKRVVQERQPASVAPVTDAPAGKATELRAAAARQARVKAAEARNDNGSLKSVLVQEGFEEF